MIRPIDAEVVREVTATIEAAIEKNRRSERLVVTVLVALFSVGLGLLILGAVTERWQLLIPGGILQLTIVLPIRQLVKLREDNVGLRILPQLMRLAETKEAKVLAAKLVKHLTEQL